MMVEKKVRWGYVTTVLGTALLGLCGCGSGSASGNTGGPVPAAELPTQGAAVMCEGLGACCRSQGIAFDDTGCRSAWQAQIAASAPTSTAVVYDASAAGQCLATIRTALAQCGNFETLETEACDRMYVGTKPVGADCADSSECAEPAGGFTFCDTPMSADAGVASSGVCTLYLPLAHATLGQACSTTCTTESAGESCYGSGSALGDAGTGATAACYTNDGLYCSSGTCQSVSEVGGACEGYAGCVSTAYCDSTTNLCVVRGQIGATCSGTDSCVETAYCATTSGVCEAKQADGETCTGYYECLGYCDIATGATSGVCAGASTLLPTAENCASYGMSSPD
jgi:hypothetical protein